MRISQTPTESVSQTRVARAKTTNSLVRGNQIQNDQGESGEADASYRRAQCVDGGDDAAAIGSVEAGAGFVQFFVRFNEACARGKDGGKGKEEATDGGAEFLRDQAGDYAYSSAEYEADNPFVWLDSLDCGESSMDDHGGYLATSQRAKETANQTGMRATVAARREGL